MAQALAVIIILVIATVLYNKFKDVFTHNKNNKGGQVIDISDAWIPADNLPYRSKETLIGPEENALYQLLISVLPPDYCILPRVRLADLLYLPSHVENRQAYQARINDRAIDFVVCSIARMQPLLVFFVENDAEALKKHLRDNFAKRAVETAGIPIINLKANPLPGKEFLIEQFNKVGIY
ncbi:MAG: DUF2726 domain-containing protein [Methylocystaceae bacterium]